jgi:uncharacterized DUF497 family protein
MLRFEWDEGKNRSNRAKHGIWFEEAQSVFDDPLARVFEDPEHSQGEVRFLIFGMSASGGRLVVAHCYRAAGDVVRIISARRMTRHERNFYEERV